MRLTVLGSGTSTPHPQRASSAYWLETSSGQILLDCSAAAVTRALEHGFDLFSLDGVWISHFHLDHVGGLAPLLAGLKHSSKMADRTKPFRIVGPHGLKDLLKAFDKAYSYGLFDQPFPLELLQVVPLEEFDLIDGLKAVAAKTPHTDESLALHVRDADDTTFVYTADTSFDDTLAAFIRKVDLLVIEASFPFEKLGGKHMVLSEAMAIVRKAAPKRTILTHLYPEWDEVDMEKEAAKYDPPGELMRAFDGLKVEFSAAFQAGSSI